MAALQIAERRAGGTTILDLWGQITIGETSEALRDEVGRLIAAGRLMIVLHMGGIHRIDSSGLGTLVAAHASARKAGGELKLARLSEGMQELMVLTKLVTVFDVYGEEQEAVASFGAGRL